LAGAIFFRTTDRRTHFANLPGLPGVKDRAMTVVGEYDGSNVLEGNGPKCSAQNEEGLIRG